MLNPFKQLELIKAEVWTSDAATIPQQKPH